jgi:hypothetical protein
LQPHLQITGLVVGGMEGGTVLGCIVRSAVKVRPRAFLTPKLTKILTLAYCALVAMRFGDLQILPQTNFCPLPVSYPILAFDPILFENCAHQNIASVP